MGQQTGADTLTSDSLLHQLVAGMQRGETWGMTEELPSGLEVVAGNEGWVMWGLGLLGVGLLVGAIWPALRVAHRAKTWPAIYRFVQGKGDVEEAEEELRSLELVIGLLHPETRESSGAWAKLTSSEQAVVMGLLQDRTVQDLASDLACTPSHIYNLRTSIRKKWKLDSDEPLPQALRKRYEELRGPTH